MHILSTKNSLFTCYERSLARFIPMMTAVCLDVYIIGHLILGLVWISGAAAAFCLCFCRAMVCISAGLAPRPLGL